MVRFSSALAGAALRVASEVDAERIAAVHVESWRETYRELMPAALLAAWTVERRAEMWCRILRHEPPFLDTTVWIAEQGSQIVGFGACGRQRDQDLAADMFETEISALYILRSHQGAGLGRALFGAMAHTLVARGHCAASLWVLRENTEARRFYERLGGVQVAVKRDERPEAILVELAYGWRELAPLAMLR